MTIPVYSDTGLEFWPPHDIAAITPEYTRVRVVHKDGTVAHAPEGQPTLNPHHLKLLPDQRWQDPAGFIHPAQPLHPLPIHYDPLYALEKIDAHTTRLHTDHGSSTLPQTLSEVAHQHPTMVAVKADLYINATRLRRIHDLTLQLDNGTKPFTVSRLVANRLIRTLGNPQFQLPALQKWKLRDYPLELATAPATALKNWFSNPRDLIANIAWQTVRYRSQNIPTEYGDGHRAFWYFPIHSTLTRAGLHTSTKGNSPNELLYRKVLEQLVGEEQLFDYRQLGFADPGGRSIGSTRPELLILAEKASLQKNLHALQQEFGMSYLVTGGISKIQDTEYLVADLQQRGIHTVRIIAYVDFDPSGWICLDRFQHQLQRYRQHYLPDTPHIVQADAFSAEEIELYAYPLPRNTTTQRWLAQSGGFAGQPKGMFADQLRPYSRVRQRLLQLL